VPGVGLVPPDYQVDLTALRLIAQIPVDQDEHRYREPLLVDARDLAAKLGEACDVVLLGSVATTKYLAPLGEVFGKRLRVPAEFVGLGDMSRGSLMLKRAAAGQELDYIAAPAGGKNGAAA
jgi:hypothetical protein